MDSQSHYIYVISDGTGETAVTMTRAALVQYGDKDINIIRSKNIRTEDQVPPLIEEASQKKSVVVYTVVSLQMRKKIQECCQQKGIPSLDLLGPLLDIFDRFFGVPQQIPQAGILRTVGEQYFKRIEAIEFTVKNDDGKNPSELHKADVILVGISRTSKTPLSIFLSHKGWKVANIPLVLNAPLPKEIFEVDQRKIVGLTIDFDSLQRIRKNRLEKFGQDPGGEYASLSHIQKEIEYAHSIFKKNKKWPIFNVTERALEETAAEITRIVAARMGYPDSAII